MQLFLLTFGMSLFFVLRAEDTQLIHARTNELLGTWYIKYWVGTLPIPEKKQHLPLPPFTFVLNDLQRLEFRMNIIKPSGCILYKLPFEREISPGSYKNWWGHRISIWLTEDREHGIAHFEGERKKRDVQIMKLFGRTLDDSPEALRIFEEFVEDKGINRTAIVKPSHVDACQSDGEP